SNKSFRHSDFMVSRVVHLRTLIQWPCGHTETRPCDDEGGPVMTRKHSPTSNGIAIAAGIVFSVLLAGCGTQTPPVVPGPFAPGTFIFSTSTDPIDGFTFANTGAVVESWTLRPPMNAGRSFPAAAALNGRIYAIGGNNLSGELDSVEMLDLPGSHVWTSVASLPSKRTGICAATANGRIYVFGGFQSGAGTLSDNLEYDPDSNQWTPKAPLLKPRSYAAAVAVNNLIYLIGGSSPENNVIVDQTSVDEYAPASDTWTPKAPLHTARNSLAAA